MMGFKNTEFFYAIVFLLIPVVIHLLNFVRTKKIFFSRVFFLKQLNESKSKIQKFKYWVILVSRILSLLFLIFAVIGFFFKKKGDVKTDSFTAYFIDNSFSIDNSGSGDFNRLKKYVLNDASVLENGCINTNELSRKGLYFLSKTQLIEELGAIEVDLNTFDFDNVISRYYHIKNLSNIESNRCKVIVLSDFQKNGIKPQEGSFDNWTFVKVGGSNDFTNLIIDSVWIESPFVKIDSPVKLKVKYSTNGGDLVDPIFCKLFIDNVQVSSSLINSQSGIVEFVFSLKEAKKYGGKIVIDDKVLFDNEYYLTIDATPKINISVISNESVNSSVYRVYSNEGAFDVNIFQPNNISSDEILKSNLVIFDQIIGNESLNKLVHEGLGNQSIVYIPPVGLTNEDVLFSSIKQNIQAEVVDNDTSLYKLKAPKNEAFFEGVFDKNVKSFDFTSVRKKIQIKKGAVRSVLSFENGEPYLVKKDNLFVFSSSLSNNESGIQLHSLFVPLMYRIAMSSTSSNKKISYINNEMVQFGEKFKVSDIVSLEKDSEKIRLDFSIGKSGELLFGAKEFEINQGIYDVVKNDSVVSNIAFNLDKSESEMEFYTKHEIQEMFPKSTVVELNNDEDLDVLVNEKNEGVSLWKYCLTLSLLFLFIEIILINQLK